MSMHDFMGGMPPKNEKKEEKSPEDSIVESVGNFNQRVARSKGLDAITKNNVQIELDYKTQFKDSELVKALDIKLGDPGVDAKLDALKTKYEESFRGLTQGEKVDHAGLKTAKEDVSKALEAEINAKKAEEGVITGKLTNAQVELDAAKQAGITYDSEKLKRADLLIKYAEELKQYNLAPAGKTLPVEPPPLIPDVHVKQIKDAEQNISDLKASETKRAAEEKSLQDNLKTFTALDLDKFEKTQTANLKTIVDRQIESKRHQLFAAEAAEAGKDWRLHRWKKVGGHDPADEKDQSDAKAILRINEEGIAKINPPGRFQRTGHGELYVSKDGNVSPVPPPKNPKDFTKGFGEALDFIRGGMGCDTVVIGGGKADRYGEPHVDLKQVIQLIKMARAKEPPLTVELASEIDVKLAGKLDDKDQKLKKEFDILWAQVEKDQAKEKRTPKDLAEEKAKEKVKAKEWAEVEKELKDLELKAPDRAIEYQNIKDVKGSPLQLKIFADAKDPTQLEKDPTALLAKGSAELDKCSDRLKQLEALEQKCSSQAANVDKLRTVPHRTRDELLDFKNRYDTLNQVTWHIADEVTDIRARMIAIAETTKGVAATSTDTQKAFDGIKADITKIDQSSKKLRDRMDVESKNLSARSDNVENVQLPRVPATRGLGK